MFMYKTSLDCLPLELERNTEEGDGMDISELSAGYPPHGLTVCGGDSPSPTTEETEARSYTGGFAQGYTESKHQTEKFQLKSFWF